MPREDLDAASERAFDVSYRMLGSVRDAEDIGQEAMLRLARADRPIDEPVAWVTTVATRLSIDHLRLARVQRETYVGPWLPEPLVVEPGPGPADHADVAEAVSQALLVVLERLTPMERAAFLLREAFGYEYADIAAIIGREEANCRQLVARARKHVQAGRPRFDPDPAVRRRLLEDFIAAAEEGDLARLERTLAEEAVFYADGGGNVPASRHPLVGANRIARAVVAVVRTQRRRGGLEHVAVTVNGQPGALRLTGDGALLDLFALDVADGRIQAVRVMRNPDKLAHMWARGWRRAQPARAARLVAARSGPT
jgi:RNA polymerase sigma-70 factor (ECF subfamily)